MPSLSTEKKLAQLLAKYKSILGPWSDLISQQELARMLTRRDFFHLAEPGPSHKSYLVDGLLVIQSAISTLDLPEKELHEALSSALLEVYTDRRNAEQQAAVASAVTETQDKIFADVGRILSGSRPRAKSRIPIRLLPVPVLKMTGSEIRETIAGGPPPALLELSDTSVEMLSILGGQSLTRAQRSILSASLREHLLTPDTGSPMDTGPFSQASILGAIIGLVHFMLHFPQAWLFVRIPETTESTPDTYALPRRGAPWLIEHKAVAPLASEQRGKVLDTCERVYRQHLRGRVQLEQAPVAPKAGAPSVAVGGAGSPGGRGVTLGGKALTVVVLPQASLHGQYTHQPVGKRYCPPSKRCIDACLKGPMGSGDKSASLVSLLWHKENESRPRRERDRHWSRVLSAALACETAAWTGSSHGCDVGLARLSEALTEASDAIDPEQAAALLHHHLRVTAARASQARRREITQRLLQERKVSGPALVALQREADSPAGPEQPVKPHRLGHRTLREVTGEEEVVEEVRGDDASFASFGFLREGELRMSMGWAAYEHAFENPDAGGPFELALQELQEHILPGLSLSRSVLAEETVTVHQRRFNLGKSFSIERALYNDKNLLERIHGWVSLDGRISATWRTEEFGDGAG
ncbi:hypothetical protein [Corallococcus carmarthensis]|uniref:Uncharacterized protein n=1 Tax=Corallococcus carmarthensis TaxID=2316728 RepID=A0A3A8KF52_9BACT|nr:hypothetical protein [Corallococcus carmarthensis]RKH06808.1 hypothetical protein D7X32_04115 [Corallococcus carmarthensis]